MALRELLLPWSSQPQGLADAADLLGGDAFVWSAPQFLIAQGSVSRTGTDASGSTRAGQLGIARAWTRAANAGSLFGTFQHVKELEITVAVVAAPVAGSNRKVAFSQRTSSSNAAQFLCGFNIDGGTSVGTLSGGIGLISRNTSSSGGGVGASSQFDGLPHAWVLANGTSAGYVYRDGVAQTVSPSVRPTGTVWTSAQVTRIGNIGDYAADGAFVCDDPIYLVIVWPRVLPSEVAQLLSSELAKNLGSAFHPQNIWVPVAAGGGISLVVADALHAHAADNVVLTSATAITIADALHAHAADNVVLQIAGATNLTVADALHAHTVDNVVLTSQIAVVVADALHAHTADGLTLTAASVLALQDALHAHAADNLTLELSGGITLTLADALHAHTADGVLLTVSAYLVVSDALHAHAADNILLSIPGAFRAGNPRVWILDSRQRYSMVDSRRRVVHLN